LVLSTGGSAGGATAMSESESEEADMGRLQGIIIIHTYMNTCKHHNAI